MKLKQTLLLSFLATSMLLSAQETDIESVINLDEVVVTAQGREERMLEVPITMTSLSGSFLQQTNTIDLQSLSNFVPGLNITYHSLHRPRFVIRGVTSDEVSPTAQPRVSTYFNNAPISRASMANSSLFDMERVEVVKGPQGTLFGRGAQVGGINFITRRPMHELGGHVASGIGNFGMYEMEGVVNIPVSNVVGGGDRLMFRTGVSHRHRDGYVENLSGGSDLAGFNSTDLRFSMRYLPNHNFRIDLVVDYQRDRGTGTPFMSKRFPNIEGNSNIFDRQASLGIGEDFYNRRNLFGMMLDMRYQLNANNYITSLTSLHDNSISSRWSGCGTQAAAIVMDEAVRANQFTQEFRWNFTHDRFRGFVGANYWLEDVTQDYGFMPNEQMLIWAIMDMFPPQMIPPGMLPPGINRPSDLMILPNGTPNPMTALPGAFIGMPFDLPIPGAGTRTERRTSSAINSAFDLFANFDFNITKRLILNAGVRGTWENLSYTNFVEAVEGSAPSVLGMLMQQPPPNLLFATTAEPVNVSKTYFATIWRTSLRYLINNNATVFGGFSTGRRPPVLQGAIDGTVSSIPAENVHSFELGFKYLERGRFSFDVGLFYQTYRDFQAQTFENFFTILPVDRATSYGLELSGAVTLCRHFELFGNYAYINARFNSDIEYNGQTFEFEGNRFRLTPDHSFTLGLNARANLSRNIGVVFTPTYSFKSKVYFEDNNDPELVQDTHGLLNLNLAFRFHNQGLNVSFFANNVTNENTIISAGNTGLMFGLPTFVPGLPRTFGARARWNF